MSFFLYETCCIFDHLHDFADEPVTRNTHIKSLMVYMTTLKKAKIMAGRFSLSAVSRNVNEMELGYGKWWLGRFLGQRCSPFLFSMVLTYLQERIKGNRRGF